MKKSILYSLVIIVFCMCVTLVDLNGRELVVNGKTYDVSIPEGMSAEDAFYEAFELYLEAEDSCTEALEELKALRLTSEQYKAASEVYKASVEEMTSKYESALKAQEKLTADYKKLSEDYEELSGQYEKLSRPEFMKGIVGLNLLYNEKFEEPTLGLTLGGFFLEKIAVATNIEYNILNPSWRFGISAGLTF